MKAISKRFGRVRALDEVDFELRPGEVHALVGENGAGKSTLIKVLAGMLQPEEGSIAVDGDEVRVRGPAEARRLGLTFIFQELAPLPHFSVAEYLNLGKPYRKRLGLVIDWKELMRQSQETAERVGFDFPVEAPMGTLTVAQQRLAEIGQGLVQGARLVVMDEPTATLSDREVERLFAVIRDLREHGVAVLYVSHRLEEVYAIADRVTVFRDGKRIATHAIDDCPQEQLVKEIIGGTELVPTGARTRTTGAPLLEARGVSTDHVTDVWLTLSAGEIVGLGGLVGSGRTELARALYGLDPLRAGEIHVDGAPVRIRSPRDAIGHGVGLMPEERKTQGILAMTVRENVTIGALHKYTRPPRWGLIRKRREREATRRYGEQLGLKSAGPEAHVSSLSGGNQQKVVLSRLLDAGSRVLLLDEPTKGVDIGAKQEMFRLIQELAAGGAAVLFISSDHMELAELCDRGVVLREGRVAGELDREHLDKASILSLSYGKEAE